MVTEAFRKDLEEVLNKHSAENKSDTPDFILAEYLIGCLEAWNQNVASRDKWYGHKGLRERLQIPEEPGGLEPILKPSEGDK